MLLENTEANRQLAQAAASLAIEDMYVSKEFMKELVKVANGEKTEEELIQELKQKYAR